MRSSAPIFRAGRFTTLLLLAILLGHVIGCTRAAHVPPDTLVVAIEGNPTNLDPRFATDAYSERIGQLLFSSLVRTDERGDVVPELALSWEHPDAITYIFHLKPGVRFHDGSLLTSEDVKYTYDSIRDPSFTSPFRQNYANVRNIEAPDSQTVVFRLVDPQASFLIQLVRGIVSKNAAIDKGKDFAEHLVGSGPFRFVRFRIDEIVELERFEECAFGTPGVSRILVKIIPEDTVRLLELKKGTIHWIQNAVPLDMLPRLLQDPHLRVDESEGTTYAYLGMNLSDPILKDRSVREAIALSIDRDRIIREIYRGRARPATGVLSRLHWGYEKDVPIYPYNPVRAKELLDNAGYPAGRGKDGKSRFSLLFKTSQNETAKRVAEILQQELARVGVRMDIRSYEWGTFYADIKSGNFQLYTLNWIGIKDPDIYYDLFYSKNIPPLGANRNRYSNPALDVLLVEGRRESNLRRRKAVYSEVQKIVAHDLPYVSLWTMDNVVVMRDNVKGYNPSPSGDWASLKNIHLE